MEEYWLKKDGEKSLLVFALGWASDYHAVEHICPSGFDVVCFYDYTKLEPIETSGLIASYARIYLFAWSFGVWAAEQFLGDIPLYKAVAINGSPFPIHDEYGIPKRIFELTLRGLKASGIDKFNHRVCGDFYDACRVHLPQRTFEDQYAEFIALSVQSVRSYQPQIKWAKAFVGRQEEIFPVLNLCYYWGAKAQLLPLPHYPFLDAKIVLNEL